MWEGCHIKCKETSPRALEWHVAKYGSQFGSILRIYHNDKILIQVSRKGFVLTKAELENDWALD